ncbi:SRPBCC family protein [Acuticoccus kandeliae]|uniref:SRPBCC family protein n=1 Tax=Acuticoccus kandeliae TaxID=2073160 RepID=UPI0013002068|nr:carbon monoxide dehydrogenase subunit G [Acuticoccus kandeliae]
MNETPLRAGRDGPRMPEGRGYQMRGSGATVVAVSPEALWAIVMDEARLAAAIPGAETLHRIDEGERRAYAADVGIGVGRIKGTYHVSAAFAEEIAPESLVLFGGAKGPFGSSSGEGWVDFTPVDGGTAVTYFYAILITGLVARVGGRLLDAAADKLIEKFFARLAKSIVAQGKIGAA